MPVIHRRKSTKVKPGKRHFRRWSSAEESILKALVDSATGQTGEGQGVQWAIIAKKIPGRDAKACRHHWVNVCRPGVKYGAWSAEEERQLAELHSVNGTAWALMANHIEGRSENSIKNHWNALIRSRKLSQRHDNVLAQYMLLLNDTPNMDRSKAYEAAVQVVAETKLNGSSQDNVTQSESAFGAGLQRLNSSSVETRSDRYDVQDDATDRDDTHMEHSQGTESSDEDLGQANSNEAETVTGVHAMQAHVVTSVAREVVSVKCEVASPQALKKAVGAVKGTDVATLKAEAEDIPAGPSHVSTGTVPMSYNIRTRASLRSVNRINQSDALAALSQLPSVQDAMKTEGDAETPCRVSGISWLRGVDFDLEWMHDLNEDVDSGDATTQGQSPGRTAQGVAGPHSTGHIHDIAVPDHDSALPLRNTLSAMDAVMKAAELYSTRDDGTAVNSGGGISPSRPPSSGLVSDTVDAFSTLMTQVALTSPSRPDLPTAPAPFKPIQAPAKRNGHDVIEATFMNASKAAAVEEARGVRRVSRDGFRSHADNAQPPSCRPLSPSALLRYMSQASVSVLSFNGHQPADKQSMPPVDRLAAMVAAGHQSMAASNGGSESVMYSGHTMRPAYYVSAPDCGRRTFADGSEPCYAPRFASQLPITSAAQHDGSYVAVPPGMSTAGLMPSRRSVPVPASSFWEPVDPTAAMMYVNDTSSQVRAMVNPQGVHQPQAQSLLAASMSGMHSTQYSRHTACTTREESVHGRFSYAPHQGMLLSASQGATDATDASHFTGVITAIPLEHYASRVNSMSVYNSRPRSFHNGDFSVPASYQQDAGCSIQRLLDHACTSAWST